MFWVTILHKYHGFYYSECVPESKSLSFTYGKISKYREKQKGKKEGDRGREGKEESFAYGKILKYRKKDKRKNETRKKKETKRCR